jgi:hypothetical protein
VVLQITSKTLQETQEAAFLAKAGIIANEAEWLGRERRNHTGALYKQSK